MKRIVVAPMRWESKAVRHAIGGLQRITAPFPAWRGNALTLVECGVGPERAARITSWLGEVDEVWLVGVAGGLVEGLETGDVLLADSIIAGSERLPCEAGAELRARLGEGVRVGPLLSSARALIPPEEKRAAAARTGALAVEMEAAPLARWAAGRGVRFVHLRVILDPVDSTLYGTEEAGDGRGRFRPLIGSFYLAHPRALRAMLDLHARMRVALGALSALLARALAD
jgi:nucleoside phosphorylase